MHLLSVFLIKKFRLNRVGENWFDIPHNSPVESHEEHIQERCNGAEAAVDLESERSAIKADVVS